VNVEQVKATIRQGIEACDEAESVIGSVRDRLRSARTLTTTTTYDSRHSAVERGLASLRAADHEAELVLRRLYASTTAARGYLGSIG
jgi:hypothetical protein